jgi:hypothetical protein
MLFLFAQKYAKDIKIIMANHTPIYYNYLLKECLLKAAYQFAQKEVDNKYAHSHLG